MMFFELTGYNSYLFYHGFLFTILGDNSLVAILQWSVLTLYLELWQG